MAQDNTNSTHLRELSGSNYEIADGEPNIKGWDLKDEAGKKFGKVKDLLFQESTRKVRYIVADLGSNDFDLDDRKVLVPIGIASLHEHDDDVILPGVTATQLQSLPVYRNEDLAPGDEQQVRNVFAGVGAGAAAAVLTSHDDLYSHEHYNHDNLYRNRTTGTGGETIPVIREELEVGKREVETGAVRLKARVVETPVEENINLRHEKVTVERTPVDRQANPGDLTEEAIEAIEMVEVPVVKKEARVVEEVSLNKEVTEREETIRDTVRNTEVDIDKDSDTSTRPTGNRL